MRKIHSFTCLILFLMIFGGCKTTEDVSISSMQNEPDLSYNNEVSLSSQNTGTIANSLLIPSNQIVSIQLPEGSSNIHRLHVVSGGSCFYFIDDTDYDYTIYKYSAEGEFLASKQLGDLQQMIRLQLIGENINVISYKKSIVLDYDFDILKEITLPDNIFHADFGDYDVDADLEYLIAGSIKINLATQEQSYLFNAAENGFDAKRNLGDKLLCLIYNPPRFILCDWDGNNVTEIDLGDSTLLYYPAMQIVGEWIYITNGSLIQGIYNYRSQKIIWLALDDCMIDENNSNQKYVSMTGNSLYYIDTSKRIHIINIQTGENITAQTVLKDAPKIEIKAVSETGSILYIKTESGNPIIKTP